MSQESFNPKMILLQIAAIQSLFYAAFVASTVFVSVLFGLSYTLGQFFDYTTYSFADSGKTTVCVMLWMTLVLIAFLLPRIIERTRKCMDFVVTLVVIHILISWAVGGFPSSGSWWAVWVTGAALCTVLGEYLCLREERREIRLGHDDDIVDQAVELGKLRSGSE